MIYELTIKKNASGDWIVEPNAGASMVRPGDKVVWQIDPSESVTAHLQFLDDIFEPSSGLDMHWVGLLQPAKSLELTIASKALPDPNVLRRTYGYAVAVVDPGGTRYAIGNNPPPDLDVGN